MDLLLLAKTTTCQHTDAQHTLTGTWCTPELEEAVCRGYRIVHIHEICYFPEPRTGLFADYVNTWLNLKDKASGWPDDCTADEQRAAHVAAYETREGIALDPSRIDKNNGQRPLAKLMQNSMRGKFDQPTNKFKFREFADPQSFHEFMDSNQHNIRYVSALTIYCNAKAYTLDTRALKDTATPKRKDRSSPSTTSTAITSTTCSIYWIRKKCAYGHSKLSSDITRLRDLRNSS